MECNILAAAHSIFHHGIRGRVDAFQEMVMAQGLGNADRQAPRD
jgi:hypothetical protein